MDVWEARAVLGVADGDGWEVVRARYRRLIREAHPDLVASRPQPPADPGSAPPAAGASTAGSPAGAAAQSAALPGPGSATAQPSPGPLGATTDRHRRAAVLNEAYAVLSRAKRAGGLAAARPAPARAPAARAPAAPAPPVGPRPPAAGVTPSGPDTLLLAAPPEVALPRLLDAAHRVGSLGYVDRSSGVFEVIVRLGGEACSLLVMLQGRAHGTEAVFAVESLVRAASHSPEPLVRQFAAALR